MITFREFDFWLMKGFGGIINLLHARVTQIPAGFQSLPRKLLAQEARRIVDLNEAVQAAGEGPEAPQQTDLICLDNWFIMAFTGLDRHLKTRADGGPVPISETNLQQVEEHIERLRELVASERAKCHSSSGKAAA